MNFTLRTTLVPKTKIVLFSSKIQLLDHYGYTYHRVHQLAETEVYRSRSSNENFRIWYHVNDTYQLLVKHKIPEFFDVLTELL